LCHRYGYYGLVAVKIFVTSETDGDGIGDGAVSMQHAGAHWDEWAKKVIYPSSQNPSQSLLLSPVIMGLDLGTYRIYQSIRAIGFLNFRLQDCSALLNLLHSSFRPSPWCAFFDDDAT
jgi:hypothetical protein